MHGLLLIDKPQGITSHDIVRRVRRKLGIRRIGHGGTLDPLATGLVPVAVGDATRLLEFFSDSDKGYAATMRLGVTTDSQDAEGTVVATGDWLSLTCAEVETAIGALQGEIDQVPPMFSALKQNGVPLYRLARQGMEVDRPSRRVTIRSITMTACELPDVSFDVICSKGTYVRTLAHDIGQALGCGAHLTALHRFRHGPYVVAQAVPLETFEAAPLDKAFGMMVPLIEIMAFLPLVRVADTAVPRLLNGVPPRTEEADLPTGCSEGDLLRLTDGEKLLAIAAFAPSRKRETRGDFELAKVFTLGQ